MLETNIFGVVRSIKDYGVWYAIWMYGVRNWWVIWVVTRMISREGKALREHAEYHYR